MQRGLVYVVKVTNARHISLVFKKGGICPTCSGTKKLNHNEAVAQMIKYLAARGEGETFTPLENYVNVATPWKGVCRKGHECNPRLNKVQQGEGICRGCAKSGYNQLKPGFLYILRDQIQGEDCAQFGISNNPKRRLAVHKSSGFASAPLLVVTSNSGALVSSLEGELITEQKRRSIPTCTESGIKFSGSTEAFTMGSPEADAFLIWILNTASANPDFEKVTAPYLRPFS
jgi:hypothetical protein